MFKIKIDRDNFTLTEIVSCIYLVYMLFGSTSGHYLYIGIALLNLWFLVIYMKKAKNLESVLQDRKIIFLFIFISYVTIVGSIQAPMIFTAKQAGGLLISFSPMFFYSYYSKHKNEKRLENVTMVVLVAWFLVMIKALQLYSTQSNIARVLASDKDYLGDIAIGGGYTLAYGTAILLVLLLDIKLQGYVNTTWKKIVFWIYFITGIAVVYQTNSTVTFVVLFLGLGLCLLFRPTRQKSKSKNMYRHKIVQLFLCALVFFSLFIFKAYIGKAIIGFSRNSDGAIAERIQGIGYALIYGTGTGEASYFVERMSIPLKAFHTFLNYPLLGIVRFHGNGYLDPEDFGAGNHCEWADALCNYGLFFGLIFLAIYVINIRFVQKSGKMSWAWVVVMLGIGLFNPFKSFQSHMAVFFIIPAIKQLLWNEK